MKFWAWSGVEGSSGLTVNVLNSGSKVRVEAFACKISQLLFGNFAQLKLKVVTSNSLKTYPWKIYRRWQELLVNIHTFSNVLIYKHPLLLLPPAALWDLSSFLPKTCLALEHKVKNIVIFVFTHVTSE